MKKISRFAKVTAFLLATVPTLPAAAQEEQKKEQEEGFRFTVVKENPITSVKNQNRSSTCWSFSSIGFFEAELLRKGKGEHDLSEMFVVHKTMEDRAERTVRLHGDVSFSPGGSFYDVAYCWRNYGMVPQEVMPGILYGDTLPVHNELDAVAEGYVKALIASNPRKLTPVWKNGLRGIYDAYLGVCPEEFVYQGKKYTPKSYAESLGLDMDDYVSLTSFTHHPYYTTFALEIQDNWRQAQSYNLPLDEFMQVFRHALNEGYTIAWGADVSETGFNRQGIGVVVDEGKGADLTGSDMARWLGLSAADRKKELTSKPLPEMEVTPEMRQTGYDNWETTDDHGMLIYGLAKDQDGKEYYMVKNSWGTASKYQGIWYVSEAFVRYKTINILVHREAVPKDIRKKLGIK
ncbi:MAG: aminopeptidase [Bacteroidales bacterium]|nr:aminopeptidase [Bacteroidales bacterium]